MRRLLQIVVFVMLTVPVVWSAPRLPYIITDHVVFQQHKRIHVWGWASPGERITVSMAGRQIRAMTQTNGRWSADLPAMNGGGPYVLIVAGSKKIVVKDVLIGEVWVASGQSNMTYALDGATGGPDEVVHADYPEIRLFTVPRRIAVQPQDNTLSASWKICSPESAKDFSAVAYFFARELHRRLGVPVGVIASAWPGTRIEEWMNPEAFDVDADVHAEIDKWNSENPAVRDYARKPLNFDLQFKDLELINDGAKASVPIRLANSYEDRDQPSLHWSYDWAAAPESYFELRKSDDGNPASIEIRGALDNAADSLLTGKWQSDGTPADLSSYTGLRFKVRGNGRYRVRFLEPAINDWDDYATSLQSAGNEWQDVAIHFRDLQQEGWGVVKEFTPQLLNGITIESTTRLGSPDRPPSGLFEGMITPLLPFPIRGVVWYQGESNALRAFLYRRQLTAMIEGWRKGWRESDAPFLIVQLPNHGSIPNEPSESAWAELRQAQLEAVRTVPHTGLAVTIDLGEPNNVHPPRKLEVGQRLAYWALGTTYGRQIPFSGPLFESATVDGSRIVIRFNNVDGGLTTSDHQAPIGFSIAGSDKKFYWAHAVIEGDTIVVSSPAVSRPTAVRYAWGDSPQCNVTNNSGLAASPFRSDP